MQLSILRTPSLRSPRRRPHSVGLRQPILHAETPTPNTPLNSNGTHVRQLKVDCRTTLALRDLLDQNMRGGPACALVRPGLIVDASPPQRSTPQQLSFASTSFTIPKYHLSNPWKSPQANTSHNTNPTHPGIHQSIHHPQHPSFHRPRCIENTPYSVRSYFDPNTIFTTLRLRTLTWRKDASTRLFGSLS